MTPTEHKMAADVALQLEQDIMMVIASRVLKTELHILDPEVILSAIGSAFALAVERTDRGMNMCGAFRETVIHLIANFEEATGQVPSTTRTIQ